MMVYQKAEKSPSQNHPTHVTGASRALLPAATQGQHSLHRPLAQEETEHEAGDQNNLNDYWSQRLASASQLNHNFANIAVHAPDEQASAPVQPKLAVQAHRAGMPLQISQPAIASAQNGGMGVVQARFTTGQPNDQQEPVSFEFTPVVQQHGEVVQRYPGIDDDGRLDAVIYVIYKNNGKTDGSNILYVGQTTAKREFQRFQEHASNDKWAPWHIHATAAGIDYENLPRAKWPYDYDVIENLKDVTKFETTVAEQWWLEHYLKKGVTLLNDSTPCTIENFNKRSGIATLYDPTRIGVDKGYKPSLKAK